MIIQHIPIVFINSFLWSIKPIIEKFGILSSDIYIFAYLRYIFTGFLSLLLILYYLKSNNKLFININKKAYIYAFIVAIISIIAILANYYLLKHNKVAIVNAIIEPLIIIFVILLSRFFFNEKISFHEFIGIFLIICGIIIIFYYK